MKYVFGFFRALIGLFFFLIIFIATLLRLVIEKLWSIITHLRPFKRFGTKKDTSSSNESDSLNRIKMKKDDPYWKQRYVCKNRIGKKLQESWDEFRGNQLKLGL